MSVHTLEAGDRIAVTRDGRTYVMTVHTVTPPMSAGRASSAGPSVMAWIRPGGYGVTIDAHTVGTTWERVTS